MVGGREKDLKTLIESAREELVTRRDQRAATYDDRLDQLGRLTQSVEDGHVKPDAVRQKIEELLVEGRGGFRSPANRAVPGRRSIGMKVPAKAMESGAGRGKGIKKGPSKTVASTVLSECVASIDSRLMELLTEDSGDRASALIKIEAGFLFSLRQSLLRNLGQVPNDAVMLEDVVNYCELIQGQLRDMRDDPVFRLESLCAHLRARLVEYGTELNHVTLQQEARDLHRRSKSFGSGKAEENELIGLWKKAQLILGKSNRSGEYSILDEILVIE